jgi:hypothetical protein
MRNLTQRGVHKLQQVCDFMDVTEASPQYGDGRKQFELLKGHVDRAKQFGLEQDLHDRNYHGAVREAKVLTRDVKRKGIQPITQLALGLLPSDPKLAESITMRDLGSFEGVVRYALNLAERVGPFEAKFVEAGLKEGFIDTLRADVAKLQGVLKERDEHLRRRIGATAALEEEYARGKDRLRILGTMLRAEWENNPELLAQWEAVSRLPRPARGDDVEGETPTEVPVGTPAPAPETPVTGGDTSADSRAA